jgi:hypothetical protein
MQYIVLVAAFIFLSPSLSYAQPDALFTEVNYDFGTVSHVSHSNQVEHVFEVSNTGDEDLIIERLVTSSGTVIAVARPTRLKPGEKGIILTAMDLRGKRGIYSKTIKVYTNDPITPVTTLSIKIAIWHRIPIGTYSAAAIFAENCRTCHVEHGKGKKGWDLFKADCRMCHTAARDISFSEMSKKPPREVLKAIREGIQNTLMPGFDRRNGGPLDDAQIKSLFDLITS